MPVPVVPPSSSGGTQTITPATVPELTPDLECRITWRAEQFTRCTNPGFETDTTGWSVSAGINAAGTSITRITSDAYTGSACGQLEAAAGTEAGGHYDLGSDRYFGDPSHSTLYAARVALKRNSGTRQATLYLGSLGTSSDRASLDIDDLTGEWREYLVRWRPSADRTDAEVAIVSADGQALDVLVDDLVVWSPLPSQVENGSFLTDTTGWDISGSGAGASVFQPGVFQPSAFQTTASIAEAATSLTRSTSGPFAGVACARLVTTSTNGSGASYTLGARTFTAGRTYRLRVALRVVSGGATARLRFGSVGTVADRSSVEVTLAGFDWHTVDWTPSADRTDVDFAISNSAAEVVIVDIDEVEVYETLDEVAVRELQVSTGGSAGPSSAAPVGTISGTAPDLTGLYDTHNAASSLYGEADTGLPLLVRGTWGGSCYGVGWGRVDALEPDPYEEMMGFSARDGLGDLEETDLQVAFDFRHSYHDAREAVATAAGLGAWQLDLSNAGLESSNVFDGTDSPTSALAYLAALNAATETIHYAQPSPHANVGWVYTTIDRSTLVSDRVDWYITDDSRGRLPGMERRADTRITAVRSRYSSYDLALAPGPAGSIDYPWGAEADANGKRIVAIGADPNTYPYQVPFMDFTDEAFGSADVPEPTEVWTVQRVLRISRKDRRRWRPVVKSRRLDYRGAIFPMDIAAGGTRTLVVEFSIPMADLTVSADSSNVSISWEAEPSRVTITLRATDSDGTVDGLAVAAFPLLPRAEGEVAYRSASATAPREQEVGDYTYVGGPAAARGLGQYLTWRYEDSRLAPVISDGLKPVRQLNAHVGHHPNVSIDRYRISGMRTVVRGVTHRIQRPWPWMTEYALEELPAGGNFVRIDGTASDGIDSSAVLAP